jgi:hypothetical protein
MVLMTLFSLAEDALRGASKVRSMGAVDDPDLDVRCGFGDDEAAGLDFSSLSALSTPVFTFFDSGGDAFGGSASVFFCILDASRDVGGGEMDPSRFRFPA